MHLTSSLPAEAEFIQLLGCFTEKQAEIAAILIKKKKNKLSESACAGKHDWTCTTDKQNFSF